MTARLGGLLLLLLGLASLWFALVGAYGVLMHPSFRWITVAGGCLLLGLGAALLPARGGGGPSASALLVFLLFFALVAIARPHAGGVAPLFAPPNGGQTIDRAGYEPVRLHRLFQSLDVEAPDLEDQQAALRGVVKRLPELDGQNTFVLLEPMMACCLADAVAFGVRVQGAGGALPEDGSWVYAFGDLRRLEAPVATPEFRLGAILFNPVSRTRQLTAHEVVPLQSLLEDLYGKLPEDFASTFRRLLAKSGVAETLRADGPFTVFALHEAAFESMPPEERAALFADPERLRVFLNGFIVPGRIPRPDFHDVLSLTTLAGTTLPVHVENGRARIGGARILLGALEARNGLVYVVHPVPRHEDR